MLCVLTSRESGGGADRLTLAVEDVSAVSGTADGGCNRPRAGALRVGAGAAAVKWGSSSPPPPLLPLPLPLPPPVKGATTGSEAAAKWGLFCTSASEGSLYTCARAAAMRAATCAGV